MVPLVPLAISLLTHKVLKNGHDLVLKDVDLPLGSQCDVLASVDTESDVEEASFICSNKTSLDSTQVFNKVMAALDGASKKLPVSLLRVSPLDEGRGIVSRGHVVRHEA